MRITILNFRDHVTPHQLRKGEDYFRRQKVSNLKVAHTGLWEADVNGRELYKVEILIKAGNEIKSVLCDCIAHVDNSYCKHVLAALLAIEEEMVKDEDDEEEIFSPGEEVQAAIDRKDYGAAIEIAKVLIFKVPRNARYEPSPEVLELIHTGFKLLLNIAGDPLPADIQENIYQLAFNSMYEERFQATYLHRHWLNILMKLSTGKEHEIIPVIDQLLKLQVYQSHEYLTRDILFMKMRLLRKSGFEAEAREMMNKNPEVIEMRDLFIKEAVERNDYQEAKRLAEEGCKGRRGMYDRATTHFENQLFVLAKQFNDVEGVRKSALNDYNNSLDIQFYLIFKETYDPADWPEAMEKNFVTPLEKKINDNDFHHNVYSFHNSITPSRALATIYMKEKELPKIMQLLQRKPSQSLIELYTDVLLPLYPKEMLVLYINMVREFAVDHKHGDAILWICSTMNKIKKWQGGKAEVSKLVKELITKYPTRPKLHEALRRV